MSSQPPKLPPLDELRQLTGIIQKLLQWVKGLIHNQNCSTLLLLVGIVWFFLFKPHGGIALKIIQPWWGTTLPPWYYTVFWLVWILIIIVAFLLRKPTAPSSEAEAPELVELRAIKGLHPFTSEDAATFRNLQREPALIQCLTTITDPSFRFGILIGLSGCGKTSFLQAGLVPRLKEPKYNHHGIYVRFSSREPLATIQTALAQQLEIPLAPLDPFTRETEIVDPGAKFLQLLTQAVEAAGSPVVLFFDQFEQWFIHYQKDSQRKPLLQALKNWYSQRDTVPVKIFISIRSDLYYLLHELQQTLGYSLRPQDVFQLEKFSLRQATQVLKVIAQTENLDFDHNFLPQLTQEELAHQEDGLISPVDLQILAWMIEGQNIPQLRAFNRRAFEKFGGAEELLSRYLKQALRASGSKAQRKAAVKVLLALTDLDQPVRSEELTLEELKAKLTPNLPSQEIKQAVNWLKGGKVRLINPVDKDGAVGYELAHECLIPAIIKQSDRELTAASRANQLLERRLKEWLRNNRSNRYLFSWWELWSIERKKPYLVWGRKIAGKQQLLALSRQLIYKIAALVIGVVLTVASFSGWLWLTPQGQIQQVRWSISNPFSSPLELVRDHLAVKAAVALGKDGRWQSAFKLVKEHVQDHGARGYFLKKFSTVIVLQENPNQAKAQLKQALALAQEIKDPYSKSDALINISAAYSQLNNSEAAQKTLQDSFKAAQEINKDPSSKSRVLSSIAAAYLQLNNSEAAQKTLQDSFNAAQEINKDLSDKSDVLSSIAAAYPQLKNSEAAYKGLQNILKAAQEINNPSSKSDVLSSIAAAYPQLNNPEAAQKGLQEIFKAAQEINNPSHKSDALSSIATAYPQLNNPEAAQKGLQEIFKAAQEINHPSHKSDALSSIATAYPQLNNPEAAQKGLQEIFKAAQEINQPFYKSRVLSSIARAYPQLNNPEAAQKGLQEIFKAAQEINHPFYKSRVLSSIARAYLQLNNSQAAQKTLQEILKATQEINNPSSKSDALISIATAYSQLNNPEAAQKGLQEIFKAAQEINNPSSKSDALISIATAYSQLNNPKAAQKGLQDIFTIAQEINDPVPKSDVLISIAAAYSQLNNPEAAQKTLQDTLKAAQGIKDPYYKSRFLISIATVYLQLKNPEAAEKGLQDIFTVAQEIKDPSDKSRILTSIAAATRNLTEPKIRQSILQQILSLTKKIDNPGKILAEISFQYALDSAWGKALHVLKTCPESEKVPALAKILTLWAENN